MNQSDIDRVSPRPDHANPHAVYTYYGFAAYWAQLLELAMLNLVAALRLASGGHIDAVTYKTSFENLNRQTVGMLLRKCRETQQFPMSKGDEQILQEALEKRNYLAHRFFSVHDAELLDDPQPLVNELRELSALLADAQPTAQSLYTSILIALDVDPNLVLKEGLAWENVIMAGKSNS